MDFGIRGVDPEPRGGYRLTKTRDNHLQAFSDACYQRHEAHHFGQVGPSHQWPGRAAFRSWPEVSDIAFLLIVGDWKIAATAAGTAVRWEQTLGGEWVTDIPEEVLDPPAPPEVDWHATYALELAARPEILADLDRDPRLGDGIEYVLERAQLRPGERAVMRAWLYGGDLARVAEDLGWRPQTVATLHRNALDRLAWLGRNPAAGGGHGNVRGSKDAGRAGGRVLSRAIAPRRGVVPQPLAS